MNRIVIIGVCVASVSLLAWLVWPRQVHRIIDTVASLEPRISMIMRSAAHPFLIVRVAGAEDFLQLTAAPDGAQIDFPLITERQRTLETRILEVAAQLQLDFHETRGSDGSRFLDCDIKGTSHDVATACHQLLAHLFGISEDSPLIFETDENI